MIHHTHIICHYNEIGIKGGNRDYFEKRLVDNIKNGLNRDLSSPPRASLAESRRVDERSPRVEAGSFEYVRRISGRIIIKTKNNIPAAKYQLLNAIFGIANFSFAIESKQDIKILQEDCWNIVKKEFSAKGGSASGGKTFRVTTQRSEKNYPLTSQQVNEKVGNYILKKSKAGVSLKEPDINCFIEIVDKRAFIYLEKISGPGGMPVGTGGKALVLLSGGIDSPVAAYYALKRGIRVDFIHFHSTSPASVNKVKKLAKIINKFQLNSKIFIIPFEKIQKEIMVKVPPKLRVIFYRRIMLKIAEAIANKEKYLVLITGEAVGQVASQTLENIKAVEEAVNIPVLRPLIGFDKEEIVNKAKVIGTYDVSILPHEDCCTRFVPKHPETKAKLAEVKEAEKNLDVKRLIKEAKDNYKIEKHCNF